MLKLAGQPINIVDLRQLEKANGLNRTAPDLDIIDKIGRIPGHGEIEYCDDLSHYSDFASFNDIIQNLRENFDIESQDALVKRNKKGEVTSIRNRNVASYLLRNYVLVVTPLVQDFDPEKSIMWIYNVEAGLWQPNARQILEQILEVFLHDWANTRTINSIIRHIQRMTYADVDFYEQNKFIVGVQNCVLNFSEFPEKLIIENFHPSLKLTRKLTPAYNPKVECPEIIKFLHQVLDEENIVTLQEMFGDLIYRDYFTQMFFIFFGGGGNGKGTTLRLFGKFLGKENYSTQSLQALQLDRFSRAELLYKHANLSGDLKGGRLSHTNLIKQLTGQEPISAQKKHQDPFTFVNYALIVASSNHTIQFDDDTEAFNRRIAIIPFPNSFRGKKKDKNILDKLTTQNELSGLLNWSLEGLKRLFEQNGYTITDSVKEMRLQYERSNASSRAFIKECLDLDEESEIPYDELNDIYLQYCTLYDCKPEEKKSLTENMRLLLGVEPKQLRRGELYVRNGKQQRKRLRMWPGIKVNIPEQKETEESEYELPTIEGLSWIEILDAGFEKLGKKDASLQELTDQFVYLNEQDMQAIIKKAMEDMIVGCIQFNANPLKCVYRLRDKVLDFKKEFGEE
ncbi:MAG: phage/plasmid primase, P4 family [Promethearchaeota archaeon]